MAILNKSKTALTEKDYWLTPYNLISDALILAGVNYFDLDVCASNAKVMVRQASAFISEEENAIGEHIKWFRRTGFQSTSFCNPPFSLKWEFFKKGIEQVNEHKGSVIFVLPYTPASKIWRKNIDAANCIVYVPDGRYNYILPDGREAKGGCNFDTCLVLIVPFFTNGAKYINYNRGLKDGERI